MKKNLIKRLLLTGLILGIFFPGVSEAKSVKVVLHAKEVDLPIDNKGTLYPTWTFDGTVPGPLVRVTEGDTVEFTLINDQTNKNPHSIDFHAARVNVVKEFSPVNPGESKSFSFKADFPGVFFYHCGMAPMIQHVARGMFGVILVDPKSSKLPKADREYVLVQSELYPDANNVEDMMKNRWGNVVFNGGIFKYDPVHDEKATRVLQAKPGERVRIYFVNAGPNEFSSFHPIAGIWDKVYPSGNPKNVLTGLQSYTVGPGDGATFDLISPVEGGNAIVTHSLHAALTGSIAVILFKKDADPTLGRGDKILLR
ncbi:MAG: multicopper oxidase domain-containing protein [Nitrospirae bacterium]|nr:multicopper oxidase domain-containing protein [Nitrospirota bacterium]MBI3350965.1 multicopper oxidase domain-containing protein [Nitrospirota bacterium]